jgi:ABC-type multidrug transport system fused ATPase/permease subunit
LEEERLQPSAVFAGLAFFNQLTVPLFIFPLLVPVLIDAMVSGRRIAEFLSLPEMDPLFLLPAASQSQAPEKNNKNEPRERDNDNILQHNVYNTNVQPPLTMLRQLQGQGGQNSSSPYGAASLLQGSSDSVFVLENIAEDEEDDEKDIKDDDKLEDKIIDSDVDPEWIVRLENASFCWGDAGETGENSLSNISLKVGKDQLTVIVGPTGSGKSTLLSALLGEISLLTGQQKGRLEWAG